MMTITKLGLAGVLTIVVQGLLVAQPSSRIAVVRGRCVDESGQPLAGCKVSFTVPSRSSPWLAARKPPAAQTTGKDGRFEFHFLPPPSGGHLLTIAAKGRLVRHARWGAFNLGQVEDLHDIWVPVGSRISGTVLNRDRKPVRAVVAVEDLPTAIGAGRGEKAPALFQSGPDNRQFHRDGSLAGRTAAEGVFQIASAIPPGEWPVRVTTKGLTQMGIVRVVVPKRGRPELVNIVV